MLYIVSGSQHEVIKKAVGSVLGGARGVPTKIVKLHSFDPATLLEDDVCLFMGSKCVEMLGSFGLIPKNRSVGSMRQRVIEVGRAKGVVTHDPYLVAKDYSVGIDIRIDAMLAARVHLTGKQDPVVGEYKWVKDFSKEVWFVEAAFNKTSKPVPVVLDLETVGLDEFNPDAWIVSISFTTEAGKSSLQHYTGRNEYPKDQYLTYIEYLLTSPKVALRGANLKYDMRWIRQHWGIEIKNFKMDTTLVGSLLDENRSNSLEVHTWLHTDMGGYDRDMNQNFDKGKMHLIPKERLITYAGGDTDACYRISEVMKEELLKDKKLANFYVKLLHPSSIVFERMESRGLPVDLAAYKELENDLRKEIEIVQATAEKMMGGRLKVKHKGNLKLSRAAILSDWMFSPLGLNLDPIDYTAKSGAPSTSIDHFNKFLGVPEAAEVVGLIRRYNKATKMLGTYVEGFLKHLRSDGRFHASYMLFRSDDDGGTNTGRLSCKDPALQTLPKHDKVWAPRFRNCFPCFEGYTWVAIDYSQGELRVAADIANETTMLKMYADGIDLHLIAGARALGISPSEALSLADDQKVIDPNGQYQTKKTIRQNGKASNFGFLYGMQAAGYVTYARDTYGVLVTEKQAQFQRDEFFKLFPRLLPWHSAYQAFAHKNGYVRTPLGRVRHLPMINSSDWGVKSKEERRAINAPVQATLSDLTQLAGVMVEKEYGVSDDYFPVTMTHDELVFAVKTDQLNVWVPRLVEVFENLPLGETFGWYPKVKFVAEPEFGPRLGSLKEWH